MMIPILYYLGDTWAVTGFVGKSLGICKRRQALFGCSLIGLKILSAVIGRVVGYFGILSALCGNLILAGLIMVFSGEDKEKKLFTAAIVIAGRRFIWNFCASFLSALTIVILHTIKGEELPFIDTDSAYSFGITAILYIAGILFFCFLCGHGMFLFEDKSRKWFLTAALPLFLLTAVIDLSNWGAEHGILLRSGGHMNLYYDQLFSYIGNCTLETLCMLSAGFYVFGLDRIDKERRKKEIYHARIASYKMLEEQHEQTRKFRHDHKNHMLALSGLMENKEYDRANDYIRQMIKDGNFEKGEEVTGNSAVDALLYRKRKAAEDKNILWECDVALPHECTINEYDLCVVFGNILDNAIEACERCHAAKRFINIHSCVVKKCLLLEVENSNENTDMLKAGSGKKQDSGEHGIGLLNVKDVVSKYNGVINVRSEGNTYKISMLFPLVR